MKILITGAGGMLAFALKNVFSDQETVTLDQSQLDITNAAAVTKSVKEIAPQLIINAAAYTDVDGAETNRALAFAVNETGVHNLAQAAEENSVTIVHYSTDYIFPGTNPAGYREDDQPGPAVNMYGESKLAGEKALVASGARAYLLRTAWLYGPNGKNFVDTMLQLAQTKPSISVVNDQHGSPTYTLDVARATKQIIEEYQPGTYHTVNDGVTSWYNYAQKIFSRAKVPVTVTPTTSAQYPRPAKRPQYSMLLNTRGPALRTWEEALDDYLNTYHSKHS